VRESPMSRITGPGAGHGQARRPRWRCRTLLLAALITTAPLAPAAQDYEAGRRAYLAGDYAEALGIWQPLADAGNKLAQFSLGSLYFEGAGVEKDYAGSAKWFQLAADQGYAPAEFNLGNAYKHGNGVEQDDVKAAEWWQKAAEQEFADAQYNLALQYYFGRGVPKDEEIAVSWYRRAAKNGHTQSQRLISMIDPPANEAQMNTREPAPSSTTAASETESTATAAPAVATGAAVTSADSASAATATASTQAGGESGESWILEQDPEDFTLQLLATHDEKLIRAYLHKHQFTEPAVYFAFQRNGKQWYAAVYGSYLEKSEAQDAVATLPPSAGKNPPWIRQFGGIQKLITAP